MAKIVIADTLREVAGKGSVVKAEKHEGPLRRPTEVGLDDYSPAVKKTPEDFRREAAEKEATRRKVLAAERGQ